ncbi:MAG: response regulator [Alphaproteobacteria bacterium]|nr:response regulator [Alphaproteobacteria bacterium]
MQAYDLRGLGILVLEKHLLIRKLLTDVFSEFGVPTVQSTPEPDVAWKMFCNFPVDIILCDWTEGLDGMAFLTKVRQDIESPNPFVPLVICTANSELRHVCTARDTGMTEFLAKPVSAHTIYGRICALVENHRPFIRVSDYFGPDRRRRQSDRFAGEDRRHHLH